MNKVKQVATYAGISLLISLFFIFLGSDSVSYVVQGEFFVTDLVVSFFLTFLLLVYLSRFNSYLNKKYSWQEHLSKRLSRQILGGILVPAIFVYVYMYIYLFWVAGFDYTEVPFFYTEFPISVLLIIAINIAFAAYLVYKENKHQQKRLQNLSEQLYTLQNLPPAQPGNKPLADPVAGTTVKTRTFIAASGNKNIPIPADDICYFYKDGNYTQLKTFESKTFLLNHTLDDLIQTLDEVNFFRINRQFILNRQACDYFTNEDNGKLELFVKPEHSSEIIISQKRASAFREWLHQ